MAIRDRPVKIDRTMQYALTTPVLKSLAVASALLGLGAAASALTPDHVTHRLRLHAVDNPSHVYLTVFRRGDIRVRFEGKEIIPVTFKTRGRIAGCRWLGIEKLVPRDERSFDYEYSEQILSCQPGATPWIKTPRKGVVTVED
jgi:hypothetical protein